MIETFLRLPEVRRVTGLGRTTIYERVAAGTFPQPVSLHNDDDKRAPVAWVAREIAAWQRRYIEERGARQRVSIHRASDADRLLAEVSAAPTRADAQRIIAAPAAAALLVEDNELLERVTDLISEKSDET